MKKWRCSVCGYVHVGETPPDECPVCGADSSKFEEVIEAPAIKAEPEFIPVKGAGLFDKMVELMLKNHLHPIAVHTPNGIVPAAVLFLLLTMIFQFSSFEVPAFYNMVVVLLAMPAVLFTGYIEWQKHYGGARTSVFMIKISCGVAVFILTAMLVVWRIADPGIAAASSPARWVYLLLHLAALAAVGVAGNLGGKLVFGRKR